MQKKSFEVLMKELESLVNKLESGETELDKSLEMYKNGVSIIKELNNKLSNAKKQIKTAGEEPEKGDE